MEAAELGGVAVHVDEGLGRGAGGFRGGGAVRGEGRRRRRGAVRGMGINKGMHKRLAGGDARARFVREAALQKVCGRSGQRRRHASHNARVILDDNASHHALEAQRGPIRKHRRVVRQPRDSRPIIIGGRSPDPEDLVQLVNFRIAGEQRRRRAVHGQGRGHLGQDAADAPDVDRRRVVFRSQQYLRCSIPQRHHLARVRARPAERAREAEVRDLERPTVDRAPHQDVLGLEVAMQDAPLVEVRDAREDLRREVGAGLVVQRPVVADVLAEVAIQQFHQEVDAVVDEEGLAQRHDVWMREILEQRDLAQRRDRHAFLVVLGDAHPLQGEDVVRRLVADLVHRAVDAGADGLDPLEPAREECFAAQPRPRRGERALERLCDRRAKGLCRDLRG
mmetsp:Transcript_23091/g.64755  ORF Transcript_23091/g.64755 Transcript_23091/m.64755 type:complete len:392 (-) Transcript_23091:323-1498(-)